MIPPAHTSDHFLSEEDLDLRGLTWDELLAEWDAWRGAASATDDEDADLYSHGIFLRAPKTPDAVALVQPKER
ncbi:MAG: hypothetical protein ABI883_01165 [Chthoniobacterales bacterium]